MSIHQRWFQTLSLSPTYLIKIYKMTQKTENPKTKTRALKNLDMSSSFTFWFFLFRYFKFSLKFTIMAEKKMPLVIDIGIETTIRTAFDTVAY